jgi:hypothetical protein
MKTAIEQIIKAACSHFRQIRFMYCLPVIFLGSGRCHKDGLPCIPEYRYLGNFLELNLAGTAKVFGASGLMIFPILHCGRFGVSRILLGLPNLHFKQPNL